MMYFKFYVRKYARDSSHVLDIHEVQIDDSDIYEERLVSILDRWDKLLRTKIITLVKVLWNHHGIEEGTRELESVLNCLVKEVHHLISRTEFPFSGKGCHDPGNTKLKFKI